jgi:glycosyltransferase involved in cell wall biosynthesis
MSLKVCGDGPLLQPLREQYSGLVDSGLLSFPGHVSGRALATAYASSDVLVFPTTYPEGFPYVMIEAYQNELCVLATPEGALAAHVIDGVTGFQLSKPLLPNLKGRMVQLASDPILLNHMRSGARSHFQRHLRAALGRSFYETLITARPGQAS